jgi:hypothetical protein
MNTSHTQKNSIILANIRRGKKIKRLISAYFIQLLSINPLGCFVRGFMQLG